MKLDLPRRLSVFSAALVVAAVAQTTFAAQAEVKISSQATQNMNCTRGGTCSPTSKKAVLNVTDLADMLAKSDTIIESDFGGGKDIEVDAALSWTSTHRLTLNTSQSIIFNEAVTVAGTGALTIVAADFRFLGKGHVEFWDGKSRLTINGHDYALIENVKHFRRALRNSDGSGSYYAQMKRWSESNKLYTAPPIDKPFNGVFEGLGNEIAHLTIHASSNRGLGLFSSLDFAAVVRDVRLTDVDITGSVAQSGIGALASGSDAADIRYIHVTGQISASGSGSFVGGIFGASSGLMRECSSSAAITLASGGMGGGLVGWNLSEGKSPDITDSYSTATISGTDGAIGGLIGQHDAGEISNTYASAAVAGGGTASAGGLIGIRTSKDASITNSYSTGAVSSGAGAPVGGSIGQDLASGGISNDYWDLDTSGVSNPHQGAGNVPDDPGITGLTDAQLKSGLPAGFDPKVWAIDPKINNGYPYLINNPPPK